MMPSRNTRICYLANNIAPRPAVIADRPHHPKVVASVVLVHSRLNLLHEKFSLQHDHTIVPNAMFSFYPT